MKQFLSALLGLSVLVGASACSEEPSQTDMLVTALANEGRAQEDRDRDAARKPAEVLEFFGVTQGMTAMDMMAASGYYTEVLSLAVGAEGHVYAQNPEFMLAFNNRASDTAMDERLAGDRLPNVERLDTEFTELGVEDGSIDVVVTALNFHDVHQYELGVAVMLDAIYRALKPGGVLGVIDHAGDAGKDNPSMHRIEEQVVKDFINQAGFELVGSSDVLRNPEDDRSVTVFDSSIRGKTDRFVMKFTKP